MSIAIETRDDKSRYRANRVAGFSYEKVVSANERHVLVLMDRTTLGINYQESFWVWITFSLKCVVIQSQHSEFWPRI